MKIRKLHLKHIGPFDDAELEFPPGPAGLAEIHIFTGQNGSGKTTLLTALSSIFTNCYGGQERSHGKNAFVDFKINQFSKRVWERGFNSSLSFKLQNTASEQCYRIGPPLLDNLCRINKYDDADLFDQAAFLYGIYGRAAIFDFAVFAFSGYRQVKSEKVEAIYEPRDFNPLSQSLEFVKDYSQAGQVSINQLITNNISKRALSKEEGETNEAEKYATVLEEIEKAIFDVTGEEIKFKLKRTPVDLRVNYNGEDLEFDVLPDGLRSLISWIADLLGRVDLLKWADDLPITDKNLILFLDEIEVHLHPAWQRKVLPVVQKLFKNAQIFVSTHSPFVVNSVDDAWVYKLELDKNGKATVAGVERSENSNSITQVLREIFDVKEWFGLEVQNNLNRFEELRDKLLANGTDEKAEQELAEVAAALAQEPSDQLRQIVRRELLQLEELKGINIAV